MEGKLNEEIVVAIGGSTSGLATALRGARGMVNHAAEGMKESFKDVFKHLSAPLSIAGAFEAVKSLMEDVKNIKRISESTGLDTGITQDLLNLGKASGVASDQIESMMDKFVKKLAPGSDPEQALYNIADKLAGIEDPATRAKVATDAFGKSGAKLIPILEQGSEGIKRMAEEWGKLSDAEIEELEVAGRTIEKTESKAKVQLARTIEWIGEIAKKARTIAGSIASGQGISGGLKQIKKDDEKDVEAEMAVDNAKEAQKVENAKKAAQDKKEAALKAAKEIAENEELINAKPQEKVLLLTRKILELRREMEDSESEKEKAKLAEKMVSLEEKRKGIQDQIAEKAKHAAEQQKHVADEIKKTTDSISKLGRQREHERMSEFMPTLEELANSGSTRVSGSATIWQQGPFAGMARQLMNLQGDAKQSLIWGNKDRFNQDVSRIDELKKTLTSAGVMSPDDKLTSIDEHMEEAKNHLKELNDKAGGDGIKVQVPDE